MAQVIVNITTESVPRVRAAYISLFVARGEPAPTDLELLAIIKSEFIAHLQDKVRKYELAEARVAAIEAREPLDI